MPQLSLNLSQLLHANIDSKCLIQSWIEPVPPLVFEKKLFSKTKESKHSSDVLDPSQHLCNNFTNRLLQLLRRQQVLEGRPDGASPTPVIEKKTFSKNNENEHNLKHSNYASQFSLRKLKNTFFRFFCIFLCAGNLFSVGLLKRKSILSGQKPETGSN